MKKIYVELTAAEVQEATARGRLAPRPAVGTGETEIAYQLAKAWCLKAKRKAKEAGLFYVGMEHGSSMDAAVTIGANCLVRRL